MRGHLFSSIALLAGCAFQVDPLFLGYHDTSDMQQDLQADLRSSDLAQSDLSHPDLRMLPPDMAELDMSSSCTPILGCTSVVTCTTSTDQQCTSCAAGRYISQGVADNCAPCPDNRCSACSSASVCTACATGYVLQSGACVTPSSCAEILLLDPTAISKSYTLNTGGTDFSAHCDMDTEGGGWTLALKVDGELTTFEYDDAIWEDTSLLRDDSPGFDRIEAKLETFNSMPFSEVLIIMEEGANPRRALRVQYGAKSLLNVFRAGYQRTFQGRTAWTDLIPLPVALQLNCNREGFNNSTEPLSTPHARVRIGILGNGGFDCTDPTSYVGVGGTNVAPCAPGKVAGNSQCVSGTTTNKSTFAWVFVRGLAPTSCSVTAYNLETPRTGNSGMIDVVGMDFEVDHDIEVTDIGVFDSGQDGLIDNLVARIWDRTGAGAPVEIVAATKTFPAGMSSAPDIAHIFLPITPPLLLSAGFKGTIVAENYINEPLINEPNIQRWNWGDDNNGMIRFTGKGRFGPTPGTFPAIEDPGEFPIRFGAGSFKYRAPTVLQCR